MKTEPAQLIFIAMVAGMVLFGVAMMVGMMIAYWRICSKMGYPGALALLMFVPGLNLIFLFYLAFSKWPIEQRVEDLQAAGGSASAPPPIQPLHPRKKLPAILVVVGVCIAIMPVVLAIAGIAAAILLPLHLAKTQNQNLARLHRLQGPDIARIVVLDDSAKPLVTISNEVALATFAAAARATQPYWPNHPGYTKTLSVEIHLTNGTARTIDLHTMGTSNHTIYLDFVERTGTVTRYFGHGQSDALYQWMEAQGLLREPAGSAGTS